MIDQLLPIANHLKDKKVFSFLRQPLNLLFTANISSFLFENFYFNYKWINPSDYDSILDFLFKGFFFIPLSIFCIVWASTYIFSFLLFRMTNFYIAKKYKGKIKQFSFDQNITKQKIGEMTEAIRKESMTDITQNWFIQTYLLIKEKITPETTQKFRMAIRSYQNDLENNFTLFFRGFIACTIYLFVIPHFGWLLYSILFIIMIISTIIFSLGYQLTELIPALINKGVIEIEKLINENEVEKEKK